MRTYSKAEVFVAQGDHRAKRKNAVRVDSKDVSVLWERGENVCVCSCVCVCVIAVAKEKKRLENHKIKKKTNKINIS